MYTQGSLVQTQQQIRHLLFIKKITWVVCHLILKLVILIIVQRKSETLNHV